MDVRRTQAPPADAHVGAALARVGTRVGADSQSARTAAAPSKLALVTLRNDAKAALTGAGWTPAIASAAVATAATVLGDDASLEQLLREALRVCRRRTS